MLSSSGLGAPGVAFRLSLLSMGAFSVKWENISFVENGLECSLELLKVEESSHHSTHELSEPTPTPVVIKFKELLSHLDGCTSKNKRAYT